MKKRIIKAEERFYGEYSELITYQTLNFAGNHSNERKPFGELLVFNEEILPPGKGLPMHPHLDVEILTILLEGSLEFGSNKSAPCILNADEAYAITTGREFTHYEKNPSLNEKTRYIQFWLRSHKRNLAHQEHKHRFPTNKRQNALQAIACPFADINPKAIDLAPLKLNLDAFVFRTLLDKQQTLAFKLQKPELNGLFCYVIDGEIRAEDTLLKAKDAIAISEVRTLECQALKKADLLFIETPCN